jgi:hypothetical protein
MSSASDYGLLMQQVPEEQANDPMRTFVDRR